MKFEQFYSNKDILILGGTGFIGTNLVKYLTGLGATITIVSRGQTISSFINESNVLTEYLDISTSNPSSILRFYKLVEKSDIIFDLAGQSGAVSSTHGPYADLQNNVFGQYNLLEISRIANPDVHIVFLSSRLVYGKALNLPVAETHPNNPTSFYGINKLTAEKYHKLYWDIHKVKTTILRVTIPYGPYKPIQKYKHGIINLFLEKASKNQEISIYGKGEQLRDIIYIDDLIEAMITVPLHKVSYGKIYNVGSGKGESLASIANEVCKIVGGGKVIYIDWPKDALQVETGDFYSNIQKVKQELDWFPRTNLSKGIQICSGFYKG